jgi:Tfp pilus assembly protein PilF
MELVVKVVFFSFSLVTVLFLAGCAGHPPVEVVPGNTSPAAAQVREGIIELNNGEYESAGERFETALLLDPKLAEAHYNLAIVLDGQGKHAQAVQHLKEAASLAPNNPAIVQSEFYLKQMQK